MSDYIKWEDLNMKWESIKNGDDFMNWEDIRLVEEVAQLIRRGGGSGYSDEWLSKQNPWEQVSEKIGEEKTEKFIKIYCTVNNIDYERGIKLNEGIKVSVERLDKVFEKVSIKVDVKK